MAGAKANILVVDDDLSVRVLKENLSDL